MARFLQLSDMHVVAGGSRASRVLDTRTIFSRVIDQLMDLNSALGPLDAVLVSGDISDDGSADSYAYARAELDRLGLPLCIVPGNHDAREPMRAAFSDLPDMPSSGLIDWATVVGETLVVGLDTLVEGQAGGRLREESLGFLTDTLQKTRAQTTLIMLHHPPIRTGIRFMDAIGLENSEVLEGVLAKFPESALLVAGHVHGIHHGQLGHHRVATAPSTCSGFALDRRKDARVGFFDGPTGCAIIDTSPGGTWSAISFEPANGPFPF